MAPPDERGSSARRDAANSVIGQLSLVWTYRASVPHRGGGRLLKRARRRSRAGRGSASSWSSKRDAARQGRRARHCDRAMPMPAAAAAAAPTALGNAPPTTPSNAVVATICALFFSARVPSSGEDCCGAHLRRRRGAVAACPLAGRANPLLVRDARGRSARLFQRLLEQRAVGNHAVQVAAQRGQRGAEVAERELA